MPSVGHQPRLSQGSHPGGGDFFFFSKNDIRKMIRNLKSEALRGFQEGGRTRASNALESGASTYSLRFGWREAS